MGSVCCLKKKKTLKNKSFSRSIVLKETQQTKKSFLKNILVKLNYLIMKMYNHPYEFWQSQTGDNDNYHINIYYNLISMHNWVCTSCYLDLDVVVPQSIWPKIVFL